MNYWEVPMLDKVNEEVESHLDNLQDPQCHEVVGITFW